MEIQFKFVMTIMTSHKINGIFLDSNFFVIVIRFWIPTCLFPHTEQLGDVRVLIRKMRKKIMNPWITHTSKKRTRQTRELKLLAVKMNINDES